MIKLHGKCLWKDIHFIEKHLNDAYEIYDVQIKNEYIFKDTGK